MVSCLWNVDSVLEDLIALGKELKTVTMDEFKCSWFMFMHHRHVYVMHIDFAANGTQLGIN